MYSFVYDIRSKRANQLVFSYKKIEKKSSRAMESDLQLWSFFESGNFVTRSTPLNHRSRTRKILIPRCEACQMETNVRMSIKALFVCVCIQNQNQSNRKRLVYVFFFPNRICFFVVNKQGTCTGHMPRTGESKLIFYCLFNYNFDRFRCRKIKFYILRYDYCYDYVYYYLGI